MKNTHIFRKWLIGLVVFTLTIAYIPLTNFIVHAETNQSEKGTNKDTGGKVGRGNRIEQTDLRTADSKTFLNNDGTYTSEISQTPIHYKDKNGEWKDIDNKLVDSPNQNKVENKSNDFSVKLDKSVDGDATVSIEDKDKIIDFGLNSVKETNKPKETKVQNSKGIVEDNSITYPKVLEGVNLKYSLGSDRVKEDIIYQEKPENGFPEKYTYKIDLKGLEVKQENKEIYLIDPKSKEKLYYIDAPLMYDSFIPQGYKSNKEIKSIPEEAISYEISMDYEEINGQLYLHIKPNQDWLNDKKRIYPLTIDPTIVRINSSQNVEDTNIRSNFPTQTGGNDTELGVGLYKDTKQTNVIRSLLKFNVSSIPKNSEIMKADLNLWMSAVSNDTPINISAYQLSNSWDENQASWNYSKTSPLTSWSVKGGDYTSTVLSSMEVGNQIDLAYSQKWDIPVGLINKWVTNPSTNNGIILKSNSESKNTYKKFISSEYPIDGQYQPLLVITYKTGARLGIEDYWEYDSHPLVGGTSYTNLTTGNNVIQYEDFTLPSRGGFGLDFNRTYNSKSQENSIFGYGWTATGLENLYVGSNNIDYTDEDGTTHKFTYDDASALYKSEAGKYLTIKKSSESINNKYVYYYELQDKYGNKKVFKIDEFNNDTDLTLATLQYWEDRHGNRINFEYNSKHQLIKITSDLGNGLVKSIELSYNTDGYVESVSYEGSKFTYSYKNDQMISMNQLKSDGTYSVTQFEYKDNRISAIIDPNGRRTDFTYQNEMLTKVQEPQEINGVKDPSDRPGTEYSIDIANKSSIITYPEGNHETYYSNDQYVTIKKIDSDGMETTYTLDENYNPTTIIEDGHPTTNTYDNKGNLTSTTDPEHHTISYEYTTFSNIAKMIDSNQNPTFYTYNAKGDLLSIKYPDTGTETYQYDSYGDIQSITHPNDSTENINYDYKTNLKTVESFDPFLNKTKSVTDHQDNVLERTDGKGNSFTYTYDEKNELTTVSDPNKKITKYEYDANGNITKITNSKNKETNFEYDGQNNLQKEKNALGDETRYQYDLNGNLEKTLLPNDHIIINNYDYSVDQLKSIEVNGMTMWGYGYDSSGSVTTICEGDFPCKGSDVLKTISYKDDGSVDTIVDRGNLINYTDLGTKQVLKYQVGNETESLQFSINSMDKLSSITKNGDTTPLATFDYEKGGIPKLVRYKNGYSIEMYYNHNRLSKYMLNNSSTQEPLDTYTFDYDANNNITKIYSEKNGTTSYTYDDKLDQLKKEKLPDGTTISYEYDEVGNRISKSITKSGDSKVTQYSYNDANQLIKVGEKTYQYDKNGNLKNDGSNEYIFNDLNQLEEIKDQTGKTISKYTYDEEGKRISSITGTDTIHYFYDGNQVIYETNSENQILREYTYNDAGQPLTMTSNGKTYYYLYNQHGDVIALTDDNGKEVASYTYDAWGNILTQSGDIASENPYRYAGYRFDENSKLYYLVDRYYNSETAIFLSKDSEEGDVENPISLNGYNYGNNNPVMMIDPNGHFAFLIPVAYAATIAVLGVGVVYYFIKSLNAVGNLINQSFARVKSRPKYRSNYEIHHIVAQKAKKAQFARGILKNVGITVNDSINLISIKTGLHRRMHTNVYYSTINTLMGNAYNKRNSYSKNHKNVVALLRAVRVWLTAKSISSPF